MIKYVVNHDEFENLKERFSKDSEHLEKLVERVGPKSVIKVHELSNRDKGSLSAELLDHLYRSAYALKPDVFWSYYLQLAEILNLPKSKVSQILEIGIGIGVLKLLMQNYDYRHITIDLGAEWKPDLQGNVLNLPFKTKSFDLVCAFEVLEHLPSHLFKAALREMARCAKHYVFISLPCPTNHIYFQFRLTFLQRVFRRFSRQVEYIKLLPTNLPDKNERELLKREDRQNPHYWEVNRHSFPKKKVFDIICESGLTITKTFHSHHYPYHFFILCEVR